VGRVIPDDDNDAAAHAGADKTGTNNALSRQRYINERIDFWKADVITAPLVPQLGTAHMSGVTRFQIVYQRFNPLVGIAIVGGHSSAIDESSYAITVVGDINNLTEFFYITRSQALRNHLGTNTFGNSIQTYLPDKIALFRFGVTSEYTMKLLLMFRKKS
jgi:hypothetical protein